MLLHDLRLALLSFKRNPILTALTAGAIAAGIGTAMVTVTLYHAQSGNPLWWKNDRVFAVALDARGINIGGGFQPPHPENPPSQLTHRDVVAVFASNVPERKAMMYKARGAIDPGQAGKKPFPVMARLTTADFFAIFDVPFLYGAGWSKTADDGPEPSIVLSKHANDIAYGGANSVGRAVNFRGREFRVIGVLDDWLPKPKVYDVTDGAFDLPEDVFLPFRWGSVLKLRSAGARAGCPRTENKDFPDTDCVTQFWVELRDSAQRAQFQHVLDSYVTNEKKTGRFPRPLNNRLANVSTWLEMNDVVRGETRMLLALASLFLIVCILNTVGLMLAKFLSAARISGLRRALGATKADILRQHLVEVLVVGIIGGLAGLLLSEAGLAGVRAGFFVADADNPQSLAMMRYLTHLDLKMLAAALGLSLVAGLLAGLYPAWRICRVPPTVYLKAE